MKKEYMIFLDGKYGMKPRRRLASVTDAINEANRILIVNQNRDKSLVDLTRKPVLILEIIGSATINEDGVLALESAVD